MSDENIIQNISGKEIDSEIKTEIKQPEAGKTVRRKVSVTDKNWQTKLLPFMMTSLILLTLAFIIIGYFEFRDFKNRLYPSSYKVELDQTMNTSGDYLVQDKTFLESNKSGGLAYVKWRALVLLEREAMNKRHDHAKTIIFARMWTRYVGFITGMILAIVGAVFILGKLQEESSELSGETSLIKFSLKSASPGIILAMLGTILLLTTLAVNFETKVEDGNLYILSSKPSDTPPPNGDFGNRTLTNANTNTNSNSNRTSQKTTNTNVANQSKQSIDIDEENRKLDEFLN